MIRLIGEEYYCFF